MTREHGFAARLREWRQRRGWSQLDLAARADISQRHLSFLELGRASPSRDMVLRLAASLDVPLRQHNALLLAAGFAPVWQQRDLAAPDLAEVASALDYRLGQQEPFRLLELRIECFFPMDDATARLLRSWAKAP